MPATSSDVARRAGVSRATVSHVLNGQGERFPEGTRQKVLDAATALSYIPSPAGRALASGRGDTIVVLLPNTTFASTLQDAVDQVAIDTASLGAHVVVRFAGQNPEATIAPLLRLRPLAVVDFGVLTDRDRTTLEKSGAVVVPSRSNPLVNTEISAFDERIGKLQVEALLRGGPRTIIYASLLDSRTDPYGPSRYTAVARACEEAGLRPPSNAAVPIKLEGAVQALKPLLKPGIPIGIACYNDDVALALLSAARELGTDVPQEMSLVGVDHTDIGQLWQPRLTTVSLNIRLTMKNIISELMTVLASGQETHSTNIAGGVKSLATLMSGQTTINPPS